METKDYTHLIEEISLTLLLACSSCSFSCSHVSFNETTLLLSVDTTREYYAFGRQTVFLHRNLKSYILVCSGVEIFGCYCFCKLVTNMIIINNVKLMTMFGETKLEGLLAIGIVSHFLQALPN